MAAQQCIVTVNGYLGGDPKQIGANTPVTVFNMATTPGFRNQQTGQWVDLPTTWLRVKAFRALAVNAARSLRKGDPVIVTGQIGTEQWMKDGAPQSTMVITATNIGHDLNTGQTSFIKTQMRRGGFAPNADGGANGMGMGGMGMGVSDVAGQSVGADPHAAPTAPQPMQPQYGGQPGQSGASVGAAGASDAAGAAPASVMAQTDEFGAGASDADGDAGDGGGRPAY